MNIHLYVCLRMHSYTCLFISVEMECSREKTIFRAVNWHQHGDGHVDNWVPRFALRLPKLFRRSGIVSRTYFVSVWGTVCHALTIYN